MAPYTIHMVVCMFPLPIVTLMSSLSSSSEDRNIRYALQIRTILSGENILLGKGLGSLLRDSMSTRGRGRKSHFLLAQVRQKLDMVPRKQSSIEWELRALKALGRFTQ